MKFLGIDYGTKRIGVALSDEEGRLAFPKTILPNSKNLTSQISNICREEKVEAVVLGDSKDLGGNDNPIQKEIMYLKQELEKETQLKVFLEPEFFTSLEAERLQGKNEMNDASAAALILKSFLEKRNR